MNRKDRIKSILALLTCVVLFVGAFGLYFLFGEEKPQDVGQPISSGVVLTEIMSNNGIYHDGSDRVLDYVFNKTVKRGSYMVVLRCDAECSVADKLTAFPHYRLKNKNMTGSSTELVAEMELNCKDMVLLERLRGEPGVQEITVMASVSGSVL